MVSKPSLLGKVNKEELVDMYIDRSMSLNEIGRRFGKTNKAVRSILTYYDIPIRGRYDSYKISRNKENALRVNEDFFFTDSNDLYYFIGLMGSDGCLTDKNVVHLGMHDKDVVEYAKSIIGLQNELRQRRQREGGIIYVFSFGNPKIANRLKHFGIAPRKSLNYSPKNIPKNYHKDFVRGMFDGDGTIYKNKRPLANGEYSINYRVGFVSASKDCIYYLKSIIDDAIGTDLNVTFYSKGNGLYRIQFSAHKDVTNFAKWMYGEDLEHFGMARKKEKFKEVLEV